MMRGSKAWLVAAALAATNPLPATAGDARAGRAKAATICQGCHGMDGLSKHPEAPNIAGQVENYLVKTLHQYRSGERQNELMTLAAKELTDAEIENLAAYYAAIQIEVIPP
jgi:cytochrome c553